MIEKIGIKNFKSYQDAELKLAPLTVLIGANASGKTNALEAIRLLSWMAQGQKLSTLQYQVNENDKVVRGSIKNLPRSGKNSFTLDCSIGERGTYNFDKFNFLTITLEVGKDGELNIINEAIYSPFWDDGQGYSYLYKTKEKTELGLKIEYNNFKKGGRKPNINCNNQQPVFLQLGSAARFDDNHKKSRSTIPKRVAEFEKYLSKILFLDYLTERLEF